EALTDIGIHEVHLLPFHQFGEKKYEELGIGYEWKGVKQLNPEALENYRRVFLDAGLNCDFH
ncbi:MAG: glycyl-radical enzyme activating protein, partial [Eubacteriales bacterium]